MENKTYFFYTNDYYEKYKICISKFKEYDNLTPTSLLHIWYDFINLCENGYPHSVYEYDSDLFVREVIEYIKDCHVLEQFPCHQEFKNILYVLDNQLLKITFLAFERKGQYWWQKRLLNYAYMPYASEINKQYQISIVILPE
jgi:hypothetical protein